AEAPKLAQCPDGETAAQVLRRVERRRAVGLDRHQVVAPERVEVERGQQADGRRRRSLMAADFHVLRIWPEVVGVVHYVGAEPQHLLLDTLEDLESAHGGPKRNTAGPLNRRPFACTLRCMSERTRDLRVESFRPLLPPLILLEEQPL